LPRSLPVLALLLLLLPKRNRCRQALWVAAPLALSLALLSLLWAIPGIGSDAPDGAFEAFSAVPFGLAAVWLLSPYFSRRHRFLTFLGMLAILELGSLLTCAAGQPQDGDGSWGDMWIGVAVIGLLLTLAINLAGWSCRKRYSPRRFSLWLLLWIMAGWLVLFVVISLIEGPGPLLEMALAWLIFSAVSFALPLPFLVLSFSNAFYGARLQQVLRLAAAALPSNPLPAP
jgi:drug/metabolite transporter (DMT)-like permease